MSWNGIIMRSAVGALSAAAAAAGVAAEVDDDGVCAAVVRGAASPQRRETDEDGGGGEGEATRAKHGAILAVVERTTARGRSREVTTSDARPAG